MRSPKKDDPMLGVVVHGDNSSYMEGGGQEDSGVSSQPGKVSKTWLNSKPRYKRTGRLGSRRRMLA
jgi:hypothetical protein